MSWEVKSYGFGLHRLRVTPPPPEAWGVTTDTWRLGPLQAVHEYVQRDRKYGSWTFNLLLAVRRWRGPWASITLGNGAQDWDRDEEWWKPEVEE